MPEMVITAVGADRPGLVEEVTGYLLERGCNVADSRMVNLRGQFALIVLVDVPSEQADALPGDLEKHGQSIGLNVHTSAKASAGAAARNVLPFHVRASAMDQPGIVHRITHLLHRFNANIEELETRVEAGSYSGTPLFCLELQMTVPSEVQVRKLRQELLDLCDSLNCDVELQAGRG